MLETRLRRKMKVVVHIAVEVVMKVCLKCAHKDSRFRRLTTVSSPMRSARALCRDIQEFSCVLSETLESFKGTGRVTVDELLSIVVKTTVQLVRARTFHFLLGSSLIKVITHDIITMLEAFLFGLFENLDNEIAEPHALCDTMPVELRER